MESGRAEVAPTVCTVPAVQLTPHVQLIVVSCPVREQDDLSLTFQLRGHTHAQSEGSQVQGLLRKQLNKTVTALSLEQHGPHDDAL